MHPTAHLYEERVRAAHASKQDEPERQAADDLNGVEGVEPQAALRAWEVAQILSRPRES